MKQIPLTQGQEFENRKHLCEEIAKDMENDAKEFDGKSFNGKTVAEYFGNQGAAISALAELMKSLFEIIENNSKTVQNTVFHESMHESKEFEL